MQEIKIKPILWRHKIASNGEFEIRIRITQYKEVSYYGTSFTATEVNWDEFNECPKSTHPNSSPLLRK